MPRCSCRQSQATTPTTPPARASRSRTTWRSWKAAFGVRLTSLLHHRPGGGVVEPGPLRWGTLRLESVGGRGARDVPEDQGGGLRGRGEAQDNAGDVRSLFRLLRRLLRPGPEGAYQ